MRSLPPEAATAQSYTTKSSATAKLAQRTSAFRRRVLVTGAAGVIGSYFSAHSYRRHRFRLMVHERDDAAQIKKLRRFGEVVMGDITDLEQMKKICAGIDTVVHLAGEPSPQATWQQLLNVNIIGTHTTFTAARHAGCRRVIYASSIHAVSGYPADVQVKTTDPVNPGDLYGVSKCFGEALSRYLAEQEGMSAIVLRIGAFQPSEAARKLGGIHMFDAWLSRRDLNQLLDRCIDDQKLHFAIFNAISNNRFKRLDISDARELVGYAPQDDVTELNPQIKALKLRERVQSHNVSDRKKKRPPR